MTQSSKTEVLGFDEWFKNMGHMDGYQHHYQDAYDTGYEVGAQSRQSEVDELQKRIDEVIKKLESIKADSLRPSHHDYDKGWCDCAITVLNDLKGKQDD